MWRRIPAALAPHAAIFRFRPPVSPQVRLAVQKCDITREEVDAVVNAANERMLGGGGVDGAIHRAAGPQLREACARVPEVRAGVRCPTGQAVPIRIDWPRAPNGKKAATLRGVSYIINTVGPVYRNDAESAPLLRSAYQNSIRAAAAQRCRSVAFPAISCGVYGYPLDKAADEALRAIADELAAGAQEVVTDVRFCLFNDEALEAWLEASERAHLERAPAE